MSNIDSELQTKATASLKEKIVDELNIPDPSLATARDAIAEAEQDFPIKELEGEIAENPRTKKEAEKKLLK